MTNIKNRVQLTGFAGSDPIIVNLSNDKRIARISIAVNEYYRDNSGEFVNRTNWFNLVFWNKQIKLIEGIVKKGTGFSVEGKLSNQNYIDKKGDQRVGTEIIVHAVEVIGQN